MSECKLDHSTDDVKKKLTEQSSFLPADINEKVQALLEQELDQAQLNEIFHLLKKYDLSSPEEREHRDAKFRSLA